MSRLNKRSRLTRLADFLFECGMLRKTPRTGYQFLGTGAENVAEHSFRTAVIGFVLAQMAGANKERTAMMCLFHDLHEARTGDFNYVAHMYNASQRTRALADALSGTGLGEDLMPLWEELEETESVEARLAQDADQLDLMLNLKEQADLGNRYADKWLAAAVKRIRTIEGKKLARAVMRTDHTDWWFLGPDQSWWEKKNGSRRKPAKPVAPEGTDADNGEDVP
ncbi:MAG: HD domain-containing protein [Proteobacteria bacterium]|nr:HD domain-containing protein [Pseudomonadota bacterium]MBU1595947.1 HD domain-containing protein [Pseudomonadota bacterium]